jgi:glycosyltransferase involved in cell wall biosynthesis
MRLSVIIPCRNEKRHIAQFLDSLLNQQLEPKWELEILVADGMSTDGTRELLRQYSEKAPCVRLIDNPGQIVSTGLNAAILAAAGDVIIRMDAHTIYAPDYIRQCVAVLEESGADNVGGPWVAKGRGFWGRAIAAAFRSPFCTGGGKAHDPNYEGEVDTVYLGCWRRSVFDRVGLFDPDLVRNQDDELNFRLRRHGGRIWQSPRILSSYAVRESIGALFRQYLQYGFWKVSVARKHRGLASWRHAVPVLFVSSLLALLVSIALASATGLSNIASVARITLAVEVFVYSLACLASAMPFARALDPRTLILVPCVTAAYHLAYGLGFLLGILRPARPAARPSGLFTALTR